MGKDSLVMKGTTAVMAIVLAAAFGLVGCGSAQGQASSASTDASASSLGPGQAAVASSGDVDQKGDFTYEQRELWVDNGGEQIYGVAYVPEGECSYSFVN